MRPTVTPLDSLAADELLAGDELAASPAAVGLSFCELTMNQVAADAAITVVPKAAISPLEIATVL